MSIVYLLKRLRVPRLHTHHRPPRRSVGIEKFCVTVASVHRPPIECRHGTGKLKAGKLSGTPAPPGIWREASGFQLQRPAVLSEIRMLPRKVSGAPQSRSLDVAGLRDDCGADKPPLMDCHDAPALQALRTASWHETPPAVTAAGFLRLVEENHLRNFLIWHEEDRARRDDLGSDAVRHAKRAIDRFNQERNDCIERMDLALVAEIPPPPDAPLHSETPGMIVDRLSILALKEYHMREESERSTATAGHRAACAEKLAIIQRQRADLAGCLDLLMNDLRDGCRRFALYRQFKMYNDPALNPQLYGAQP